MQWSDTLLLFTLNSGLLLQIRGKIACKPYLGSTPSGAGGATAMALLVVVLVAKCSDSYTLSLKHYNNRYSKYMQVLCGRWTPVCSHTCLPMHVCVIAHTLVHMPARTRARTPVVHSYTPMFIPRSCPRVGSIFEHQYLSALQP